MGATDTPSGRTFGCVGTNVDLTSLAKSYQGVYLTLPPNQINHIFVLVHPLDMLLEIIQPWPYLFFILAGFGSTLV
jgi:hypothetical protein